MDKDSGEPGDSAARLAQALRETSKKTEERGT